MAREHEMVCTKSSIPEGMFMRNEVNVIHDSRSYGTCVVGTKLVEVLNHSDHAEGKEVKECPLGVSGPKHLIPFLHLMNKPSLRGVYAFAWPVVEHGNLSFFVHIDL